MESAIPQTLMSRLRLPLRIDLHAIWIWALTGGLVLYLGIDGGGYDLIVRNDVGVVVWWIVLIGALCGVLPAARLTRAAWAAVALLLAFAIWSAIGITWSISAERSVEEVSRLACYLGVLVLAVATHGDRLRAMKHTVCAVGAAVTLISVLAVLSRLRPELFPSAHVTAALLPDARQRLSWPLNYWNALGAFVALGIPLLLAIATSARTLVGQASGAAAIPVVALCGYLTFSRAGAAAAAAGVIVFILLAPNRIPKLATLLAGAAGSAALIAGAVHRHAVEQGLTGPTARHQGSTLLVAVIVICTGVALVQVGIGLAARHGTLPRLLRVPPRRARALLAAATVAAVVIAFAAGAPTGLRHAWHDFKKPLPTALTGTTISRFGSVSGNNRYLYWKTAVHALPGHTVDGRGPGTYQLVWLPRAPFWTYVRNAHSLYVETLSDVGIVGLVLLGSFLLFVIGTAVRRVVRARFGERPYAAAVAGAAVAFVIAAAFDWIWQVPVLPVAFLLLAASVFVPSAARRRDRAEAQAAREDVSRRDVAAGGTRPAAWVRARGFMIAVRAGAIALALACLIAIGVPLARTNAVRESQTAAAAGNLTAAFDNARTAVRAEPGSASAQLQLALVLELRGQIAPAVSAARAATSDEPQNWQTWLTLSRLEAENGQPAAAVADFRRAHSLNPTSPLFHI